MARATFRELGHKAIYVANSWRALQCIGWQHAEPVLRSLAYALVDRTGDGQSARSDLPADRPGRHNLELRKQIRSDWLAGKTERGGNCGYAANAAARFPRWTQATKLWS